MPNGRVALDLDRMTMPGTWTYAKVTSSTQARVKEALDRDARSLPCTVIAEEQTQGRGRLDRSWSAPAGSAVLMSVGLPIPGHASTFTLKAGVVVAEALIARGVHVQLKWPNDIVVVVDGRLRKLGGILAEVHRDHVVVGIGVNIDMADEELPTVDAISCRHLGTTPRREYLISDIVKGLDGLPAAATLARYRTLCATIGAAVQVRLVSGEVLVGIVIDVDETGALLLQDDASEVHRITTGDVEHVRGAA